MWRDWNRKLIAQALFFGGPHKLVRDVDARNTLIVRGERDRDMCSHVGAERMAVAFDAEDGIVGGKVDFDHDVLLRHLLHQACRVSLVANVLSLIHI